MPRCTTLKTTETILAAHRILEAEHPMTLRQLFYRLVSALAIENTRPAYQRLSRLITKARENEIINPEWLVDRSKPEYHPNAWTNTAEYLETVAKSYRRDYWEDQSYYVELWVEKDSLVGSIEAIVDGLGISLRAHRGYGSTTKKMEIARLFDSIKKPVKIFYIGDHDPSGVDIERDLLAKITSYMRTANVPSITRLGIHKTDITDFKLPPLRIKASDPRAARFAKIHGSVVVEADALPPVELRRRIKAAVEGLIDRELWDHKILVELAEFNSISQFAKSFKVRQVSQ